MLTIFFYNLSVPLNRLTNRFHVAVCPFSNRSQEQITRVIRIWKCKKGAQNVGVCVTDVLVTF